MSDVLIDVMPRRKALTFHVFPEKPAEGQETAVGREMPVRPPAGLLYYVVQQYARPSKDGDRPHRPIRRYFHSSKSPERPFGKPTLNWSPSIGVAKGFDNLHMAEAWVDFILRQADESDAWIILDKANVRENR